MAKSPAFRFYAADFLMDEKVRLMNLQEKGAYIVLLSHCWIESSIPASLEELATLCNVDPRDFEGIWERVSKCFQKRGARFINNRLRAERSRQLAFARSQRSKGKKSHVSDGAAVNPRLTNGSAPVNHARVNLSFSSSLSKTDNTPLTPQEQVVLNILQTTPPLNALKDPEQFVRRMGGRHGLARMEEAAGDLVAYCAKNPTWEKQKKNWNRTFGDWLERDRKKAGNLKMLAELAQSVKHIP